MLDNGEAVRGWVHQCPSEHDLQVYVNYEPPEDTNEYRDDHDRDGDGGCGGFGASGSRWSGFDPNFGFFGSNLTNGQKHSARAFSGAGTNSQSLFNALQLSHTEPAAFNEASADKAGGCQNNANQTKATSSGPLTRSLKAMKRLGFGGFGEVYEVEDQLTRQIFALKKIRWDRK